MNKKIKSLIVASMMVLSMCGSVFAAGNGNDGCQVPNLRGHDDGSNEHKIENVTQETWENYVATVNSTNTGIVIEAPNNLNGNGWHTYKVYKDANCDHVKDNNKQIEVLHVKFNVKLTDEELEAKKEPPKVDLPELPEEEPETGDASSMLMLGTGLASVVGLYFLRKKDDEE